MHGGLVILQTSEMWSFEISVTAFMQADLIIRMKQRYSSRGTLQRHNMYKHTVWEKKQGAA